MISKENVENNGIHPCGIIENIIDKPKLQTDEQLC